jgi:thymidylate synthase (FAD)
MSVTLIDFMGNDVTICNAARVSFDKATAFDKVGPFDSEASAANARSRDPQALMSVAMTPSTNGWNYYRVTDSDAGLLNFLARKRHFSPFTHAQVQFRIKMPLFLARQWYKSRVGIEKDCGWNEVSRRYVKSEPEFFLPEKGFRKAAANVKQGSSDELVTEGFNGKSLHNLVAAHYQSATLLYLGMMEAGCAPEDARMVLPVAMITEWIETGSIMAYARLCHLRNDEHAQSYIRPYADAISQQIEPHFPLSWRALMEFRQ